MYPVFRENKSRIQIASGGNPNYPPHLHEELELIYMQKGSGIGFCNGDAYPLSEGDFFLVFPNQVHFYSDFASDSASMLLVAKPTFFNLRLFSFGDRLPLSARYKSQETDRNLIRMLEIGFEEFYKNAPTDVVSSILSAALEMLLTRYEFADTTADSRCALRIIRYCKAHYQEELTVEQIARDLHISRSHISHTFNDKLKISFPEYLHSLRLNEAVQLLRKGDHTITEVAQLAGFQTIRTFNRSFLKHFGLSPRQFLKEREI